jgi:hypothetical protein
MTKRDFAVVAAAIAATTMSRNARKELVRRLSLEFSEINPLFRADLFEQACQP